MKDTIKTNPAEKTEELFEGMQLKYGKGFAVEAYSHEDKMQLFESLKKETEDYIKTSIENYVESDKSFSNSQVIVEMNEEANIGIYFNSDYKSESGKIYPVSSELNANFCFLSISDFESFETAVYCLRKAEFYFYSTTDYTIGDINVYDKFDLNNEAEMQPTLGLDTETLIKCVVFNQWGLELHSTVHELEKLEKYENDKEKSELFSIVEMYTALVVANSEIEQEIVVEFYGENDYLYKTKLYNLLDTLEKGNFDNIDDLKEAENDLYYPLEINVLSNIR